MALTKVSGGILDPGINVAGIVTATGFDGPFTGGSSKNINAGIITATKFVGPFDSVIIGGGTTITSDGVNVTGIVTATGFDLNGSGDISGDLVIGGNLTANGDFTTLNTTLREVELLRVDANSSTAAGIITQRGSGDLLQFFDTSTQVGALTDEGNFGLGVNAPNVKLHVKSTATGGGNIAYFDDTGSGNTGRLMVLTTGGAATDGIKLQAVNRKYLHFGNATNQLTINNNNSSVGIGTDDPQEILHIHKSGTGPTDVRISNNEGYGFIRCDSNLLAYNAQLHLFANRDRSEEYMRITNDGNVGINSTIPREKLDVIGNANIIVDNNKGIKLGYRGENKTAYIGLDANDAGGAGTQSWANSAYIGFYSDGSSERSITYRTSAGHHIFQGVNGTEFARINSAGSVGVGTDNPDRMLHIKGTGNAIVKMEANYSGSVTGIEGVLTASGANRYVTGVYGKVVNTSGSESNVASIRLWNEQASPTTSDSPGYITFNTTNDGASTATEKLRITSAGVLQIERGSASDTALEINTTSTSNACRIKFNESGSNKAQIAYSHDNDRLELVSQSGNGMAFYSGGNLVWKFDTNGHLLPNVVGAVDIGSATAEIGNVFLADSKKVFLGSDQDTEIYHNGTHSYLTNTTGNFFFLNTGTSYSYFDSNFIRLRNQAGNHMIQIDNSGASQGVKLFHTAGSSGSETLTTTTTGIEVTGEVATTQDYPDFRPVLDLNFMQNSTLDPRITYSRTGTASYVDETGRLRWVGANVPRFDHDPITGKSKGLLIEESRTNIFHAYATSYLSNLPASTYNVNTNGAIISPSDDVLAPDGSRTTTKLYWDGTYNSGGAWNQNGYARIGNYTGELTAGDYVFSFFVKRGTDGRHNMDAFLGFDGSNPTFGTGHYQGIFQDFSPYYSKQPNINGSDATIEKFANGWYRCTTAVFTADQSWTPNNAGISHYTIGANSYQTYYEAMPHYYWGFQLEKAAFATSYIGNSLQQQTTRGADITMINGENFTEFYNPVESTIVVNYTHHDGVTTSNLGTQPRVYNFRAVGGNDTRIDYVSNSNYNPYIAKDGGAVASISDGVATVFGGGANKTAVRVKENSFATCQNGTLGTGDTSGAWNPTNAITEVSIGGQASGSAGNQLSGHIQRFMYYSVGLPDSQLVTLTS